MSYTNDTFYEGAGIGDSLYRFNASSSTCGDKRYKNFITGFTGQFRESDCYTFIIQFIIVTLMYMNVGRGKYWLILFIAAVGGVGGAIIENSTLAVICQDKYYNVNGTFNRVYSFLIVEIFWITSEYSVPILNLIKMQAFSEERLSKYMKYIIYILTIPFVYFRCRIGWQRMTRGYLLDRDIRVSHFGAFGVMGLADMLCTVSIIYFVKKKQNNGMIIQGTNIKTHVKRSSYTILIVVDIVSFILCLLELLTESGPLKEILSTEYVKPFHCLKNSFALILAADAVIFKYGVNAEYAGNTGSGGARGYNGSSTYQNRSNNNYKYSNHSYHSYHSYSASNDVTLNETMQSMNSSSLGRNKYNATEQMTKYNNNNNNNEQIMNITPYNYPTFDMDVYSKSPGKNKTIIKNYTNIKTQTIMDDISNSQINDIAFQPNPTFGFLNK